RKQLRLGSRQRQAIVQSVEKPVPRQPALFLDEDAIHGRELHGRTSKAQHGNARPNAEGLMQAHPIGCCAGNLFDSGLQGVPFLRHQLVADDEVRGTAARPHEKEVVTSLMMFSGSTGPRWTM